MTGIKGREEIKTKSLNEKGFFFNICVQGTHIAFRYLLILRRCAIKKCCTISKITIKIKGCSLTDFDTNDGHETTKLKLFQFEIDWKF